MAAVFQPHIGLQCGRDADALLSAETANGWNLFAGLQRALLNLIDDALGDLDIERRGLRCGSHIVIYNSFSRIETVLVIQIWICICT